MTDRAHVGARRCIDAFETHRMLAWHEEEMASCDRVRVPEEHHGLVTPAVTRPRDVVVLEPGEGRRTKDPKGNDMALFMDAHTIEGGVSFSDVAAAHAADVAAQDAYGVNYVRYWVDEAAGKIFCLVDAPDAEAAASVHRVAHGLVAEEIYSVAEGA